MRQPLDLRKTAAITVAIANVNIKDDTEMGISQEAGCSRQPVLQRGNSSNTRNLTVDCPMPRLTSQDMW